MDSQQRYSPKILLDMLAVAGIFGGTAFDYFKDKGIKEVAIFGNNDIVSMLKLQADILDIKVIALVGNNAQTQSVKFPIAHNIKLLPIDDVDFEKLGVPVLMELGNKKLLEYREKSGTVLTMRECLIYSICKRALFDKLIEWQSVNPEVPVVICETPAIGGVSNMTEIESNYIKYWNRPEMLNKQKIKEETFYKYGYSEEDYKGIFISRPHSANKNGVYFMTDYESKHKNYINGYRLTIGTPSSAFNTIYSFGNSYCDGLGADDAHTIQSALQRELNKHYVAASPFMVINCANHPGLCVWRAFGSFAYHSLKSGDVAVFINRFPSIVREMYYNKFIWLETQPFFNRPHKMGEIFLDALNHMNFIGYDKVGTVLFEMLMDKGILEKALSYNVSPISYAASRLSLSDSELAQLDGFIGELKSKYSNLTSTGNIGAVVMNCNPFTLGHRYLIESAAAKVDRLFVFVVEEDKSVFPFNDRFELVSDATADLSNVTVVPSGKFIISQITFKLYFQKEEKSDIIVDASGDVSIFAEKIAPALNITVRFAGEEPLDQITNQYNSTMNMILPKYGIKFEVIPRKESDGAPISASRVRALLKEQNFDEIAKIVPQTTLDYLKAIAPPPPS
ncbi:hypothetical protein FACS1894208_09910 [Clostridia bacterium]|nr:hypothetical protein FACS1894208_09910 [Clostridia bacterium]